MKTIKWEKIKAFRLIKSIVLQKDYLKSDLQSKNSVSKCIEQKQKYKEK